MDGQTDHLNPLDESELIAPRRATVAVRVGAVTIGGGAPVVVQSMTNTDTADIDATVEQIAALARAGSELVRVTVDRDEAAKAVPHIREKLEARDILVPIVGDFHYIGHTLLADNPACAEALHKYRINPGNVGFKAKRDVQFSAIVEKALQYRKPVRIGVNWGSLDQELLTHLMDENARSATPKPARSVMHEAIVQSALLSAQRAEELGLGRDQIVISAKVSAVQDLISVYTMLANARLRFASWPHRGRHGLERHRRIVGGDGYRAAAGYRRHDPVFTNAGAGRSADHRSAGRTGIAPDHGSALVCADRCGVSGLRAHDIDGVSGTGP